MARSRADEARLLERAQRLNDQELLLDLARSAGHPAIRLQAAKLCEDSSALTAIALLEWDIHRGLQATRAIHNPLLLRRIARAARQDAIRAEAAIRLNHPHILLETASSIREIQSRWRIARYLGDPLLMAEIAMFKPANDHFESLRKQAHARVIEILDRAGRQHDLNYLKYFVREVPHVRYKIMAALRLPLEEIQPPLMQFLARQDYRYEPADLLNSFFERVQTAGWRSQWSINDERCFQCRGNGWLRLKCAAEEHADLKQNLLPCPECQGRGAIAYPIITFDRDSQKEIVFRIPGGD